MGDRNLAFIGIGLFILKILTSATDTDGASTVPGMLILISEIATIIYVIVISIRLWSNGAKIVALALPIVTFVSLAALNLHTASTSDENLIANALKGLATLVYLYAVFLLFSFSRQRRSVG